MTVSAPFLRPLNGQNAAYLPLSHLLCGRGLGCAQRRSGDGAQPRPGGEIPRESCCRCRCGMGRRGRPDVLLAELERRALSEDAVDPAAVVLCRGQERRRGRARGAKERSQCCCRRRRCSSCCCSCCLGGRRRRFVVAAVRLGDSCGDRRGDCSAPRGAAFRSLGVGHFVTMAEQRRRRTRRMGTRRATKSTTTLAETTTTSLACSLPRACSLLSFKPTRA